MVAKDHILGVRPARILALTMLGYLISSVASAEESVAPVASPLNASVPNSESASGKSLWLPQTRPDWDSLVARQVDGRDFGTTSDDESGEVTVTAAELLPMHGIYDEMWAGILAPVWAIMHPTQAWRILVPIPPK
jgi:hypothetical protein